MYCLEIEDPVLLDTFWTDSKGRINSGEKYAGKKIEACVVSVEEDDES